MAHRKTVPQFFFDVREALAKPVAHMRHFHETQEALAKPVAHLHPSVAQFPDEVTIEELFRKLPLSLSETAGVGCVFGHAPSP